MLLNELLRRASERDWITAKVEAGAGESLSVALSQVLVRGMRTATGRHPEPRLRRLLGVFKAFSLTADATGMVSLGVEVDPTVVWRTRGASPRISPRVRGDGGDRSRARRRSVPPRGSSRPTNTQPSV